MARSHVPKPTRTDNSDLGYNPQHNIRSALELPPRAFHSQFDDAPIEVNREFEYEDGSLTRAWDQFQADWEPREECRRSEYGYPSTRLHESGHTTASNSDETRSRFSYPTSSHPCQDASFVNISDAGWSRVTTLSYNRQLYQHHLSCPPPPSSFSNHRIQQRRSSQRTYEDDYESVHHPSSPSSTTDAERFSQGRSDWSSASVRPRDYSNAPTYHPCAGSPPDPSGHKLHGLTRRPRVQKPYKRFSRLQGDVSRKSVDLETPRATEMDCSVMSVRSNPDGSGSSFSSRFVLSSSTTRPIPIRGPDCGARRLDTSPSSHVASETERPRSRIKAREGAGSASINIYSIPKKEPHTLAMPSLMNCMGEQSSSSSPVSTPKAPPPDQHSMIREDLQQEGERPIARCRADLRISFREAGAVEDRKSLDFVRSTSPSLQVSHWESHRIPANKSNGPKQQALFQEVYQMLEPPTHPGSDASRSEMATPRDDNSGEGVVYPDCASEGDSSPDTPRGLQGPGRTLHVDIILAQRVLRDAMWEDGEGVGFSDQSCMPSASECGEETLDSNSNWSECGLDRKKSTRSVFDWGYA